MTKVARALSLAVFGAAVLAGCGSDAPDVAPSGAAPTTVAVTGGTQEPSGVGSGAGVEDRSGEPVVEQTVSLPDAPDDKAVVGIQSLTVEGETMVLRLVITPDLASVDDDEAVSLGDAMDVGTD